LGSGHEGPIRGYAGRPEKRLAMKERGPATRRKGLQFTARRKRNSPRGHHDSSEKEKKR